MTTACASLPDRALGVRRMALAVVIALHAIVLLMWQAPRIRDDRPVSTRTAITVALLSDVAPAPAAASPEAALPRRPKRPSPRPARARRAGPPSLHTPGLPDVAPASSTAVPVETPSPSETPTATRPGTEGEAPLLDSAATRRAIKEAARNPSHAAQAGIDNREPSMQTPDARLGTEIAKGAKGDCTKGEYAGGGMGLLSLPFLAAAVLAEKCRR